MHDYMLHLNKESFKEKKLLAQNNTENIQKKKDKKRGTYIRKIPFLSNLKLNQRKSPININR